MVPFLAVQNNYSMNPDTFLLDQVERFSNRWQKLTGLDCFWWSRICQKLLYISILGALFALIFDDYISLTEKEAREALAKNAVNPERVRSMAVRLIVVILSVCVQPIIFRLIILHRIQSTPELNIVVFSAFVVFTSMTALYYFIACTPLPPAKSKVRKWLESGIEFLRETLTPKPRRKLA